MATAKKQRLDFVKKIYPASLHNWNTDKEKSVHPIFDTAQAALETGWKAKGISNNIFGITKGSSRNGKTQLVTTIEYFKDANNKFALPEEILGKEYRPDKGDYKYTVKRLFRVYDNIEECLKDHNKILRQKNFAPYWHLRDNPKAYVKAIAPIYATASNYAKVMCGIIDMVEGYIKELGL